MKIARADNDDSLLITKMLSRGGSACFSIDNLEVWNHYRIQNESPYKFYSVLEC